MTRRSRLACLAISAFIAAVSAASAQPAPEGAAGAPAALVPSAPPPEAERGAEPAVTAGEAGEATCPSDWEERVYRDASQSVVRVKTQDGWGAGFFYEDGVTIVTALHVVAQGRSVQIVARTGETRRATVVHNAEQDLDLAVLELEKPFESFTPKPLPLSPLVPTVAMPVMMIGHPGPEAEGWSVSWGRVGSETLQEGAIEVDGTANPGNSGGPLLDCQGRVLGVVSYLKDTGITMAVPITELPRRGDRRFHFYQGAFAVAARFPNVVYAQEQDLPLWGVGLGGDVVVRDRWVTALQGQFQWHADRPGNSVIERADHRWQLELYEEYRFFALGYLGLGGGGTISWERQRVTTGSVDTTGPTPAFVVDYDRDRSVRLRPMVTASLELSPLYVGYAYQIDTVRPELSTHRLVFGVRVENVTSYE